jgi:hypothetical protein
MDASDSLDSVYTAVKVYRPKGRELAIADPLGVRKDGKGQDRTGQCRMGVVEGDGRS